MAAPGNETPTRNSVCCPGANEDFIQFPAARGRMRFICAMID
jgi:hypothetical protein